MDEKAILQDIEERIGFIRRIVATSGADGIAFANSGGKDCALAGILCKKAWRNTIGVILPCGTKQNHTTDADHARLLAEAFEIETRYVDLTNVKEMLVSKCETRFGVPRITDAALANIAPRLRMTTMYAISQTENRLVCGTGNRSEGYMGYFTKWGDGAYDFNPISDLTVTEIFAYLRVLGAPSEIINKAPSAGLYEGQTDEAEMGVTYEAIDRYIKTGEANDHDKAIIDRFHRNSEHKRYMPVTFK